MYKLPTPKSKQEIGIDEDCFMPSDLPKDTSSTLDVKTVSYKNYFLSHLLFDKLF